MSGAIKYDQWLNGDGTENFKCRAWVNFNGTGAVAIRASGNVSSITDNALGDYTVNFATPMPDINYIAVGNARSPGVSNSTLQGPSVANQTTSFQLLTINITPTVQTGDNSHIFVAFYR
jgi:hypothetical protein